MKPRRKLILNTILAALLAIFVFAVIAYLFQRYVIPALPESLQNELIGIGGAAAGTIALLSGLAELIGFSLKDVFAPIREFAITSQIDEQKAFRNRDAMLKLVKNTWIDGVLNKSLYKEMLIDIGVEEYREALDISWDVILKQPDDPDWADFSNKPIIAIFDDSNGALFILGEPGSGKTTLLLRLAQDAIDRAENNLSEPIPVLLNLISWTEPELTLPEWITNELNDIEVTQLRVNMLN